MSEVTLRSAKEILVFFEAHPNLSFDEINEVVTTYLGGNLQAVLFTPFDKSKEDKTKLKKQFLEWLEANAEAIDKGEITHCFLDTFKRK